MRGAVHLLAVFLLWSGGANAADGPSRWSVELKGGTFHSDDEQWKRFYGDNRLRHAAAAIAYRLWRPLELGMEVGYVRDSGKGSAPIHGTTAGNVEYRLTPVHLFLTLRGAFVEGQWLIPYAGAAYTRYSYEIRTENQAEVTGAVSGNSYRAGLQFLLDALDPRSASRAARETGLSDSYLFLEAQRMEVDVEEAELGGTSYLGGIRLKF